MPIVGLLAQAVNSTEGRRALAGTAMDTSQMAPQTGTIYRAVPWQTWTDVTNIGNLIGTRDYFGAIPAGQISPYQRYQVANNTDSFLHISSYVANPDQLRINPEAIVGPFQSLNMSLGGTGMFMLARCCGYDMNTVRTVPGTFDVRFGGTSFVAVQPLGPHEEPPLPALRSSWARTYDLKDLTWPSNPIPSLTVNTVWYSNIMELSGATSVSVQAHANGTANGTGAVEVFMLASDPVLGQGAYNEGGVSATPTAGNMYFQTSLTYTSNRPRLEVYFTPGDTSGAVITFDQIFVQAVCHV